MQVIQQVGFEDSAPKALKGESQWTVIFLRFTILYITFDKIIYYLDKNGHATISKVVYDFNINIWSLISAIIYVCYVSLKS